VKGSTDAASMEQASGTALHYLDGIAYHLAGRPTGVPVVMLHGFAADSTAWSLLARTLVKANCRVLTIDLPGHGNTVVNAHDVDSLQQGMQNVLAANTTDRAWHVVAHSLGTMPALALVQSPADFRVESLSLISPVGLGLSIDREFIAGMAKPSSIAELSHLMRRLGSRPSTLSTAAADELFSRLGQGRLVQLAESILGAHGQTLDSHATIDTLSRQLPVRIIIGHADRIIRWQDALQVSPLVGVHHFPTAGHMPHWDFPREVAQIILSAQ
jgi:pyruvate dehydrogenase E2 component (dihydrolipoamide acetyltransferase)